ncbi:MAG TPA: hypothetical protein DFJ59_08340 [Alphaproteobacteria bacterium]|nr:hypothetical protein [Alphaproteobacteria bacterium]
MGRSFCNNKTLEVVKGNPILLAQVESPPEEWVQKVPLVLYERGKILRQTAADLYVNCGFFPDGALRAISPEVAEALVMFWSVSAGIRLSRAVPKLAPARHTDKSKIKRRRRPPAGFTKRLRLSNAYDCQYVGHSAMDQDEIDPDSELVATGAVCRACMWKVLEKTPADYLDEIQVAHKVGRMPADAVVRPLFRIPELRYLLAGAALGHGGDTVFRGKFGSRTAPLLVLRAKLNETAPIIMVSSPVDAALAREVVIKRTRGDQSEIFDLIEARANDLIEHGYIVIDVTYRKMKPSPIYGRVLEVWPGPENTTIIATSEFLSATRQLASTAVTVEHQKCTYVVLPKLLPARHITIRKAERLTWGALDVILRETSPVSVLLRGDILAAPPGPFGPPCRTLQYIAGLTQHINGKLDASAELSLWSPPELPLVLAMIQNKSASMPSDGDTSSLPTSPLPIGTP